MWMLFEPPRQRPDLPSAEQEADDAAPVEAASAVVPAPGPPSPEPAVPASSLKPPATPEPAPAPPRVNGHALRPAVLLRSVSENAPLQFTLYLHPGRSCLGTTDVDRLKAQFDLSTAKVFDTVAQAELAAEDQVGFLVDVRGRFIDSHGRPRDRGALFFPRLRG